MSVVASIRARMINLLLIAIPDVSCELPLASDLLPHDHVLSAHLLRRLVFGHQRESPDLTGRIGAQRFYIHRRELQAADSFSPRLGIWMNGWEGLFLAVRRMGCFRAGCEFGTEPAHAPQPRQRPHPCDRHRRDPSRRGPAARPPAPAPERVRRPRRCPRALARALPPP